jgi:hypothetical protein
MDTVQGLVAGATVADRYRLVARLGEGTFGSVWRAEDLRLARRAVAMKFLKEEFLVIPEAVARFEGEADALAQVHHPNVVGVFDRGAWQGGRFLVMEFVAGETLGAWIERHRAGGVLPALGEVAARLDLLCAGVAAAHGVRAPGPIVHRDLKPENILLGDAPGEALALKVLDFGIARLGGRVGTRTGALLGTPLYMAPEQAMGNTAAITPATDVFALAVIAAECLTLQATPAEGEPWWGAAMQRAGEVAGLLAASRSDVPAAVWSVLAWGLQARPGDRPVDAQAFREALRGAFAGLATPAVDRDPPRVSVPPTRPPGPSSRTTAPVTAAAASTGPSSTAVRVAGVLAGALVLAAVAARITAPSSGPVAPTTVALPPSSPTPAAAAPAAPVKPTAPVTPEALAVQLDPPRIDPMAYLAPGARPLHVDDQLADFVARWAAAVGNPATPDALAPFYLFESQFRRIAPRARAAQVRAYYADLLRQEATFQIDFDHSEWVTEPESSPDASPLCRGVEGAEGDIVKVRAWAREHSPLRALNSSGEVPCPWIIGRYLLRLRRVAGELRICHETWSLREGVCASCPGARSCAPRTF